MAEPILVIGGGGFIGRRLTRTLAEQGTPVISISRSGNGAEHALIETVTGEFREPEDFMPLVERSRAVVHVATTSTPGTSAAQPLREVRTNLYVTAALLQALQSHPDVDLLYLSSGGSLYADIEGAPSNETAPIRPRSYHGAGKLAAESFISAWCEQCSGKATILRPSNVYGPGQPELPGFGVIPAAFGKIVRDEVLHVWGDGTARRDYVYIDDLVRFCSIVLGKPMSVGAHIFNACSGTSVSLNDLFGIMESVTGKPLRRSYDAGRSVDASYIAMDAGLAARTYGWRHETSLDEGLKRTWERFDRGKR